MEWELGVGAAEDGYHEVALEHLDRSFGCVAAMDVWGHQLEVDAFISDRAFECCGCLIVEFLKLWAESSVNEILV